MSDEGEYGPAMQALTPLMRSFVLCMLDMPGAAAWRVAKKAGYSANSAGALRVTAHRLMHDSRVLLAIHEEAGKRMRSGALLGADVLVKIAADRKASNKDRMKAAGMLLDRVGFGAAQTINVNQTVSDQSGKAIMERIASLASKLGVDPGKLLGGPAASVVDAEFTEVEK